MNVLQTADMHCKKKVKIIKFKVNDKSVKLMISVYSKWVTQKSVIERNVHASTKPFAIPFGKLIFDLKQVPA